MRICPLLYHSTNLRTQNNSSVKHEAGAQWKKKTKNKSKTILHGCRPPPTSTWHWSHWDTFSPSACGVALYSAWVTPRVRCQTFVARIYPYGKTKNSCPGAAGGAKEEQRRVLHFQLCCSAQSPLPTAAPGCSAVISRGIPIQDYFHKPPRHKVRNNPRADTNVVWKWTTNQRRVEGIITMSAWTLEIKVQYAEGSLTVWGGGGG